MVFLGGKNVERFWFYRKLIFNYRMLDKNRDGSKFDDIVEPIKRIMKAIEFFKSIQWTVL